MVCFVKEMSNDYVPGPDKILALFLNKCRYALKISIREMFTLSLKSGVFLKMWKQSFVTPIFKSGYRNSISKYHPVAKLNSLSKLVEQKLSSHFNNICIDNQHGFRKFKLNLILIVLFFTLI